MTGFVVVDDQDAMYNVMMKRTLQMMKRSKMKTMGMKMMNEIDAQAYSVRRYCADAKSQNDHVKEKK
jgi:hypothetical protein